jgi:hypothetical protein
MGAGQAEVQVQEQVLVLQVMVTSGCNPAQRDPEPPAFAQVLQRRRGSDLLAVEAERAEEAARLLPPSLRRPQSTMGLRVGK